ncbi:MAG: DUF2079 domain-containing protein [Chloroflexi bacterium]|nr:DUF2079 domain-containing protein [Chloroflexota bacterium]
MRREATLTASSAITWRARTLPAALVSTILSWLLATIAAADFAWTLLAKYDHFDTYAFDLGLFAQTAWNSLHGHLFANTLLAFNYLADHFAPSLAIISPLFLLWPDTRILLLLQAGAMALSSAGIFVAARTVTQDDRISLALQFAYLLAPATGWVVLDEFHPITLALPFVTFATAALWQRRPALAMLLAACALFSTEDAAAWVGPFGLLLAWRFRGRSRLWGLGLAVVTLLWLGFYFLFLVPLLRPASISLSDPHPDIGVFIYCGRTWDAIAHCLLTNPAATLHQLVRPQSGDVLSTIFGPVALLGLLGPSTLAIAPRWIIQLLSVSPANYTAHYVALLVPTAYLAAGEALGWIARRRHRIFPMVARAGALAVVICSGIAFVTRSPLPLGGGFDTRLLTLSAHDRALQEAVTLIPHDPSLTITASSRILSHVALRSRVFLPWADPGDPDMRILDVNDSYPLAEGTYASRVALWRSEASYETIFSRDGVLVQRRIVQIPALTLATTFGHTVTLVGATVTPRSGVLAITLYWKPVETVPSSLHYFVHLVSNTGATFSQHDAPLVTGIDATAPVPPGTIIRESLDLPSPQHNLLSSYHLEIGWYNWRTGQRLRIAGGGNHFALLLSEATPYAIVPENSSNGS